MATIVPDTGRANLGVKPSSCHPDRPVLAKGLCRRCYDKQLKVLNPAYKQGQYENHKKWETQNKKRVALYKKERRERELIDPNHKAKIRNATLKNKYGITDKIYEQVFEMQNNKCALCFSSPGKFKFHVDHNHETGQVRGILCHQCNWYLGKIDKDVDLINRIITYKAEETPWIQLLKQEQNMIVENLK